MDDLISRRSAIDVIKRLMGDRELSRTVQTGLHILPSVQPDPCFACKHRDEDCWEMCQYCPAERREDDTD